jgi:hypothetical protein
VKEEARYEGEGRLFVEGHGILEVSPPFNAASLCDPLVVVSARSRHHCH